MSLPPVSVDVVIPTIGRPSVGVLLDALAYQSVPVPGRVILIDDRRGATLPLSLPDSARRLGAEVIRGPARGPAAARNVGWQRSSAAWIAYLDDDVVPARDWVERLLADLAALDPDVAGSQGTVIVPLPDDRRPTDWERGVKQLEGAPWITANMALRRAALAAVGGFDERFPRAYREDADLALRLVAGGWRIVPGQRRVVHPVRPAPWWISVARQAGNADDALMTALHGRNWTGKEPGTRRPRHLAVTALGAGALVAAAAGRRRIAAVAAAAWLAGLVEFAWARIAPGPRDRREVARMVATSVAIPPAASYHWLAGRLRRRRLMGDASGPPPPAGPVIAPPPPRQPLVEATAAGGGLRVF